MEPIAELLDQKLQHWLPDTSEEVRRILGEIIELADEGILDVMRSRAVEQDVLDMLDGPSIR